MKIRSLLLGSVAAAGLTTGAYAADPLQVLTTLNLCDALGLTGLTISSDNNCLQITGEVKYEFVWGDYKGSELIITSGGGYGAFNIPNNDAYAHVPPPGEHDQDWDSKVEAYLTFVGTADTDVGPAKMVIKLKEVHQRTVRNENNLGPNDIPDASILRAAGPDGALGNADDIYVTAGVNGGFDTDPDDVGPILDDVQVFAVAPAATPLDDHAHIGGDNTGGVIMDEAYVAIGGATVLSAGRKGSIINAGDDEPFNWLGLFQSEKVDKGVKWTKDLIPDGGHVIQLVHSFGNGLTGKIGLEKLEGVGATAGTAVGVLEFAGDKVTAHITAVAGGILDGTVENYAVHAGFTGTFDILKIRGAVAADNSGYWNALASAEATFDIFKLAISGEANRGTAVAVTDFGVGASAGITVTDGITINLGGRYYQDNDAGMQDGWQAAAQLVAKVTETLTLTGEIGVFGVSPGTPLVDGTSSTDIYGKVALDWAPGGGFTSSIAGEVHQNGAYKATFKAGKAIN